MVGATGFEPATPCTPCRCATKLRYAPTEDEGCLLWKKRAATIAAEPVRAQPDLGSVGRVSRARDYLGLATGSRFNLASSERTSSFTSATSSRRSASLKPSSTWGSSCLRSSSSVRRAPAIV